MRTIPTLILVVSLALPTLAQKGPCTEEFIKASEATGGPLPRTDDVYFFAAAAGRPVVGEEERKKATDPYMSTRKNYKNVHKVDRAVADPSGEMAYEYGTGSISFDDINTGKHVEATLGFLSVWRADGGSCKVAASMVQPIRSEAEAREAR